MELCNQPLIFMLDPDDLTDFIVHKDRTFFVLGSHKDECRHYLQELEKTSKAALEEEGISLEDVSCRTLVDVNVEMGDRARTAMECYIALRQLREHERDALRDGPANAERFYTPIRHALVAALAGVSVDPELTRYERQKQKLAEARDRATSKRARAQSQTERRIESALRTLWERKARFVRLDDWSNKIRELDRGLAAQMGESNSTLNRKVSRVGRRCFQADWPVPTSSSRKMSQ
ncbi:MAG: hypothetical protein ACK4Y4_05860 [Brevundimonas sp.]